MIELGKNEKNGGFDSRVDAPRPIFREDKISVNLRLVMALMKGSLAKQNGSSNYLLKENEAHDSKT